jgi:DEAD/DEAH box helicase domain-containing protein
MLEEPFEYDFVTKGLVFRAPRPVDSIRSAKDPLYVEMSSYHATEHVIIEGSSMITGGASQDLGGISLGSSGMIFVYDSSVGGNGASKVLFDRLEKAFARGKSILSECPCKSESGCPRCTYSYRCGNNNEYLHKYASLEVYKRILQKERTDVGEPAEGERSLV